MTIAAVSIAPLGAGASVSHYVTEAVRVLETQDRVRWELGAMFTTLEGDLTDILDLVRQMQEAVFAAGAERVATVLKIDERRDRPARMEEKVRGVRDELGRERG